MAYRRRGADRDVWFAAWCITFFMVGFLIGGWLAS